MCLLSFENYERSSVEMVLLAPVQNDQQQIFQGVLHTQVSSFHDASFFLFQCHPPKQKTKTQQDQCGSNSSRLGLK